MSFSPQTRFIDLSNLTRSAEIRTGAAAASAERDDHHDGDQTSTRRDGLDKNLLVCERMPSRSSKF